MHPLLLPFLLLPFQDFHHHDLGTLGGYSAKVNAVVEAASFAGGYAIAGKSRTPAQQKHACLWLENLGQMDLGTLGGEESEAYGVSADGSVVVGASQYAPGSPNHAFRWTAATGMTDLGTLGHDPSVANAISPDGFIVVGWSKAANGVDVHGFYWHQGMFIDAGTPGAGVSVLTDVAASGVSVGGESGVPTRFTPAVGMTPLAGFPWAVGMATSISDDGNWVAGNMGDCTTCTTRAFRHDMAIGGWLDLGAEINQGSANSRARDVNANGDVVGTAQGMASGGNPNHAFLWTEAQGAMDLNDRLQVGTGWELTDATAITDDGLIVADGLFQGVQRACLLVPVRLDVQTSSAGVATATTAGAEPLLPVFVVYGTSAGTTQVPGFPGVEVGIHQPKIAGSSDADALGNASFSKNLPSGAFGRTFLVQAVQPLGWLVSQVFQVTF